MKKALFTFIFILAAIQCTQAQALRYLLKYPYKVIESKYEMSPAKNGDQELAYYNTDYSPYYIWRNDGTAHVINKGRTVVEYFRGNSVARTPKGGSYSYFRGKFPKEFNPNTVYALPVKPGKEVSWMVDPRERSRTFVFMVNYRDTVYASRGGVVCKTDYHSGLLLYHRDDTFAAYLNLSQLLVVPGEEVQIGEPIGLASHSGVALSVFFLDENLFVKGKPAGYAYTHFSPVFRTCKGDVKLEPETKYSGIIDEPLIMQDMTKSEQKRYLKRRGK